MEIQEKSLENLNSVQSLEVASAVSHQLRNPLLALRLYVKDLAEAKDEGLRKTLLDNSIELIDHMSASIGFMLDYSRIFNGARKLKPAEIPVKEFLNKLLLGSKPLMDQKQQKLILTIDENIHNLWADPDALYQASENLLTNAIIYTPKGKQIEVQLKALPENALFMVVDSGVGISEEDQKHLFEAYFRSNEAREVNPQGNGLGLAMVNALVFLWGGRLYFHSAEDEGSVFGFSIPYHNKSL